MQVLMLVKFSLLQRVIIHVRTSISYMYITYTL